MKFYSVLVCILNAVSWTSSCNPESMRYLGEVVGPYLRDLIKLHVDVQEEPPRNCGQEMERCILESDCCPEFECSLISTLANQDGIVSICKAKLKGEDYDPLPPRKEVVVERPRPPPITHQSSEYSYSDNDNDYDQPQRQPAFEQKEQAKSYYDYIDKTSQGKHSDSEKVNSKLMQNISSSLLSDYSYDSSNQSYESSMNELTSKDKNGHISTYSKQGDLAENFNDTTGGKHNEASINYPHYENNFKNVSTSLLNDPFEPKPNNTHPTGSLYNNFDSYDYKEYAENNNLNPGKNSDIVQDEEYNPANYENFEEQGNRRKREVKPIDENNALQSESRKARSINFSDYIKSSKIAIQNNLKSLSDKFIKLMNRTDDGSYEVVMEGSNKPKVNSSVLNARSIDFNNRLMSLLYNETSYNQNDTLTISETINNKTMSACDIRNGLELLRNFYVSKLNFKKNLNLLREKFSELFPEFHMKDYKIDLNAGLSADEENIESLEKLAEMYEGRK